jgi:GcrA cell cycle regulator
MNWTDERVEALRRLWAEGLSASQIAAQLGGVSRNAVIGKVHRLKLSGRGGSNTQSAQKKKAATSQPAAKTARPPQQPRTVTTTSIGATALQAEFDAQPAVIQRPQMRAIENLLVPVSRKLMLVQLNERTCKWPNGDPLTEDFNFCGNDCAETGPYCTYHARVAFQPASERRRVR